MDKKGLKLAQALLQMSCWTQNYRTRKSTAKLVYNGKLFSFINDIPFNYIGYQTGQVIYNSYDEIDIDKLRRRISRLFI